MLRTSCLLPTLLDNPCLVDTILDWERGQVAPLRRWHRAAPAYVGAAARTSRSERCREPQPMTTFGGARVDGRDAAWLALPRRSFSPNG